MDSFRNEFSSNTGRPSVLDDSQRLTVAIQHGRIDVLRALATEIDLAAWRAEGTGWTVLHLAVEHHQLELVRELLLRGVPVDTRDHSDVTPLHLAVDVAADAVHQTGSELDTRIVELLIEHGAPTAARNARGETPVDWARSSNLISLIRIFEIESAAG